MSTEKEYVVVVKRNNNLEELDTELSSSTGNEFIPERSVDVANSRPGSKRMTNWLLSDEEAERLKNDPRVEAVEIPIDQQDGIDKMLHLTQGFNFDKTSAVDNTKANWGLRRCIDDVNSYSAGTTAPDGFYPYGLDGTDVDVVIQDTGTSADHPEWQNMQGASRFIELDWYSESGLPGTMPAGHYTDYHGHGTHCAGITAGKTYGWAKNANIYAVKVSGLEGPSDPNGGISTTDCFDVIRLWHLAKTNGRPTVVNMSWGYGRTITTTDPTGGTYRGTPWSYTGETQNQLWQTYGIVPQLTGPSGTSRRIPIRLAQIDAEIEDMIDAGIHVCIAAGNQYYKIDVPTGLDYNNEVTFSGLNTQYHQGSSPYSEEAFIVGNVDSTTQQDGVVFRDKTAGSSNKGPGTNFWAPGTDIISACSDTNVFGSSAGDYFTPGYKIANIGGTSMAAPQVAGLIALHLQVDPNASPLQIKNKLVAESKDVLYSTGLDSDYTAYETSLMGSPNRMMFSKYGKQPLSLSGTVSLSTTIPLYYLSQNVTSIDEGGTVRYTLTTVNIDEGTDIPFTLSGITTSDISNLYQWQERYVSNTYEVIRTLTGSSAPGQRYRYRLRWNTSIVGDYNSDSAFAENGLLTSTDGNTYRLGVEESASGPDTIFSIIKVNDTTVDLNENFYVGYNNKSIIELVIAEDAVTEGAEELTLSINGTSITSNPITINDTSLDPTYSLVASPTSVNEGGTFNVDLTTTNIPNGTSIQYTITGTGITANDFTSGSISGSFIVVDNTSNISFTLAEDLSTEGTETITLALNNGGDSVNITIIDTSTTPIVPTYTSLAADVETANEGDTITFTLNTSQIADSTTVGYTITGVSVDDINLVSLTGVFTIAGNTSTLSLDLVEDLDTEGTETLTITLDATDSNGNGTTSLSDNVLIADTSTAPPTYSLSSSVPDVNEGDSIVITLTTTDVADATSIPYTITGVDASDIDIALTGSFTITSNTDTLAINIAADATTEGSESLTLTLDGLGEDVSVVINDTSITGSPTYLLSSGSTTVNEGDSISILLNTTNVSNGTTIPYTITGIDASDLSSGSITGNFTVSSNFASLSFTFDEDITTEGSEVMNLALDNSEDDIDITINDTSTTPGGAAESYSLSASSSSLQEGEKTTFTLTTTNVADATSVPYTISGVTSSDLNTGPRASGAVGNTVGYGSNFFTREVRTAGVRLVSAGTVGGQTAVPDAFIEKVARMFQLFTDSTGAGINANKQNQLIETLLGNTTSYHAPKPTIQRIARGAGGDYTPNFLDDAGIRSWGLEPLFDETVQNDMVWYLNSSGTPGTGDEDAQEVIEHVFHTLHMHGLDAATLKMYPSISTDWATSDLYAAMEEAYDAGKWDPSGYQSPSNAWKTDGDAFEVAVKEYLYLLNFCMFDYSTLWDGNSLAPEWTDDMRTPAGIQANNPLGYALFNTHIADVISKPSLTTIRSIFQDGDTGDPTQAGASGYSADAAIPLTGNFTVNSNTATLEINTAKDGTTDGDKTLAIALDNGESSTNVSITDSSQAVGPTYYAYPAAQSINEGSALTVNVVTTDIANATTLYWTVTNASDFSTSSGSFTITSNAGSFTVTPTADEGTEGAENFQVQIRTGSTSGTIVYTTNPITINDTSLTPTADYTFNVTNVGAGAYTLVGTDQNGAVNGNNVSLTFSQGDLIEFSVNAPGHPFLIKTVQGTGSSNQASGVTNAGAISGTVTWDTTGLTTGTYYYQCQAHDAMNGVITIT